MEAESREEVFADMSEISDIGLHYLDSLFGLESRACWTWSGSFQTSGVPVAVDEVVGLKNFFQESAVARVGVRKLDRD